MFRLEKMFQPPPPRVRFLNNVNRSYYLSVPLKVMNYHVWLDWQPDLHEFIDRVRILCDYLFNKRKILRSTIIYSKH